MNRQDFQNPGPAYRGVALWMLNDRLEPEQVVRQLEEFAEAGWGAVITRTFNGLLTPYLGEAWMQITERILVRAEQLGLKVWLQAGYMPSAMPGLTEQQALRGLALHPASSAVRADQVILAHGPDGSSVRAEACGTVADLLDGEVVKQYLDAAYHEPWYTRFGGHFGKTIEAIWVDEPHFRAPLLPWSRRFAETFERQWGYDLVPELVSLFLAVGDHQRIRHHYWRTALWMFLEGYFKPVEAWCRQHGVKFAGHLMGEDTLNNQIGWTGATMPCYAAMQLPGIDHLTGEMDWPTGKPFILTPKQLSSAASQLGKSQVLAEMYGVSTEGLTFADRKRIANWLMVQGINYRCYHAAFYSMRGRRKRIYPPHLSSQQPWWEDNRLIADPFARLSWALRQGKTEARVLVLHPIESAYCLFDPASMQRPHDHALEPEDVAQMDGRLVPLCRNLLDTQHDFEFGDETLMAQHGGVDGSRLRIGQQSYEVVVLPELITLRRSTLELLERFAAAGGIILRTGALPQRMDGTIAPGVSRRLEAISRAVEADAVSLDRAIELAAPSFARLIVRDGDRAHAWMQVRRVEGGRLIYLTNTSATETVAGALSLREPGELEQWDLESGQIAKLGLSCAGERWERTIELPPLASRLLCWRDCPSAPPLAPAPAWKTVRSVAVAEHGRVQRGAPNVLVLDQCRWKLGEADWNGPAVPLLLQQRLEAENYTGPLSMVFEFQVEDAPTDGLELVVESPERYAITVNGHAVRYEGLPCYVDRSFLPIAIGAYVHRGRNTVRMDCQFHPLQKASFALADLFENREGMELDSIGILGAFEVRGRISERAAREGCVRYAPGFSLARERGRCGQNASAEGYPFYAGRLKLIRTVELTRPPAGQRVMLKLGGLNAVVAHVHVNGQVAGSLGWAPYEVEMGEHVVEGENEITIEVVSGLRNLIGPHHRSCGERKDTWHTSFNNPPDPRIAYPSVDEPNWTDDYMVTDFGIDGPIVVEYQQPLFSRE